MITENLKKKQTNKRGPMRQLGARGQVEVMTSSALGWGICHNRSARALALSKEVLFFSF